MKASLTNLSLILINLIIIWNSKDTVAVPLWRSPRKQEIEEDYWNSATASASSSSFTRKPKTCRTFLAEPSECRLLTCKFDHFQPAWVGVVGIHIVAFNLFSEKFTQRWRCYGNGWLLSFKSREKKPHWDGLVRMIRMVWWQNQHLPIINH